MVNRLEFIQFYFTFAFMKIAGFFVKKDERIWIFGERNGCEFGNNSKYLFLYVKNHRQNIRPIWFTKSRLIYDEVRTLGGEVYFINSMKAVYYGLKAKVYIHSHGRLDIQNYTKKNSIFVNLYHGMAIKKMPERYWSDDLDIATSDLTKSRRYKAFHIDNIAITGEPRYDVLFEDINKTDVLRKYGLERFDEKTIVTYLPTFRDSTDAYRPLFSDVSRIRELENVAILEKSHFAERSIASDIDYDSDVIVNISNLDVDTQEILSITDILITDYSACLLDFLLKDKPIILYPYDLRQYEKQRGLDYNYGDITPGLVAVDEDELFEAIRTYLLDPERDVEKRQKVKSMFHKNQDGQSSERVCQAIVELIERDSRNEKARVGTDQAGR